MARFDPIESLASLRHEFGEHGGVNMSIETSSTFTVMEAEVLPELFQGLRGPDYEGEGRFLYGRHYNPTVYVLGKQLAALEGTEAAYCAGSGMGAISSTITQLCNHGEHVVASNTLYGGTFALLNDYLPLKAGVTTTFVDISDLDAVDKAITKKTKAIYAETMSNPTLNVADIPKLSSIAKRHGIQLVIDNTFCPLVVSPKQLGADIVVYSLTKYINGASDFIAGAICGSKDFIQSMMNTHTGSLMILGPTMDPRAAFQISLRIPHLGLRMQEHSRRALEFSKRLEEYGLSVVYPGLAQHPHHELINSIRNPDYGYGGIFGLDVGSMDKANRLMETLQNRDCFGYMAVSLGYFDTLMSCSASSTSSELSEEDRRKAGISPGLVRVSLGYSGSLEQRWGQLIDALKAESIL